MPVSIDCLFLCFDTLPCDFFVMKDSTCIVREKINMLLLEIKIFVSSSNVEDGDRIHPTKIRSGELIVHRRWRIREWASFYSMIKGWVMSMSWSKIENCPWVPMIDHCWLIEIWPILLCTLSFVSLTSSFMGRSVIFVWDTVFRWWYLFSFFPISRILSITSSIEH
jgi:hypothetical protein